MEKSLANELYSEILQSSNVKLDPIPIANTKSSDLNECDDDDDVWDDNESLWNDTREKFDTASDMDREWQTRRNQFHTIGYRDGVTAGNEASAQEGFNIGFKESVFIGFDWGLVRGVTSALAGLPDGLREKMIETEEKRKKLKELHESVHSLSTGDALKIFHADLLSKTGRSIESSSIKFDVQGQNCDGNSPLRKYYTELESLILETPTLNVNLDINT